MTIRKGISYISRDTMTECLFLCFGIILFNGGLLMNRSKEELSKCKFMTYEEGGMYYEIGWVPFRKIARKANAVFCSYMQSKR